MHMVQINVFNEVRVVAVAVAATTSHKTKIQTRFVTIHDKKRRWTTTKWSKRSDDMTRNTNKYIIYSHFNTENLLNLETSERNKWM